MPDRDGSPPRAWQRMLSGRRLDLLEPSPLDVEIEDIAHGLARVARWNGQTTGAHAFSVAQHSLAVEAVFSALWPEAPRGHRLYALLHDAPEYVIGDMISPFKSVMGGNYRDVEARLETAINLRFGLPGLVPAALKRKVKKADMVCAYFEATELAGFGKAEGIKLFGSPGQVEADDLALDCVPADEAETRFLKRFAELSTDGD
ncbi:MAG: HD family hydrolase [Pseudomonadota bacterium]